MSITRENHDREVLIVEKSVGSTKTGLLQPVEELEDSVL